MTRLISLLFFLLFSISQDSKAQKAVSLYSPDKLIHFECRVKKGVFYYEIHYKAKPVFADSKLGLSFLGTGDFQSQLEMGKPIFSKGVEKYELTTGKTRFVNDSFNSLRIPLTEKISPHRCVDIEVRAFHDGIAFRYVFPSGKTDSTFQLTEEKTEFQFATNPSVLALLLPNYTSSHEGEYSDMLLSQIREDTLMEMPALFTLNNGTYVAITEAALVDYAGMYLRRHNGILSSALSPLPGQKQIKVKAKLPHNSPWRVIMISDRLGSFIESNILTSLNEPLAITDHSWLKPGKTTFPWWNGNVLPDTINAPGNNFVTNKYYIDFCARNKIAYHSVVEYGLHQWYMDDGVGFQPGPHSDVTRPVPGLDMKEICDYAHSVGVGVRVWVHWAALYPKLDSAFAVFEKWGLSGMMVDFMDRDDQEMVNIQNEMLQKAAKHHLHIQFHGAYKPTGRQRTWPNEFTREGTLNYEVNKWDKRITPDHDLNIVFTRLLAGPTDYHLGGFRAVPDSLFRVQYTRPLMLGTRCHMLGMYVVLENPLAMLCDYPEAYEGQPGFDFLKTVPTTWDETRVIQARVHEYILIARRKGDDWYVGAINNHAARNISFSADFLPAGKYKATIYSDAEDVGAIPDHLTIQTRVINVNERININLAAGGGAVIKLEKAERKP